MPQKYTQEQYQEIFSKLPEELKDAVFSTETADNILTTCEQYGIKDERISLIGGLVGDVLMKVIRPEEFKKELETEIKLEEKTAEGIYQRINRLIFNPIEPFLTNTFKASGPLTESIIRPDESLQEITPATEEKINDLDNYREPLE